MDCIDNASLICFHDQHKPYCAKSTLSYGCTCFTMPRLSLASFTIIVVEKNKQQANKNIIQNRRVV